MPKTTNPLVFGLFGVYKALKTAKNAFLETFLEINPSKYSIEGSKSLEKVDISCFLISIYRFNSKAEINFFKKCCKGPPFGLFPRNSLMLISTEKNDSNLEIPKDLNSTEWRVFVSDKMLSIWNF